jgi:8-oxo-dGTP pyrophosphatase MutT (NUDIX family)
MKAHAAKALVTDAEGHVLVLRRSPTHPLWALHLDLPGGTVETNETAEEAMAREMFEEVGLQVPTSAFTFVDEIMTDGHRGLVYTATISEVKPTISISWEHDLFDWMHIDQIMNHELPEGGDLLVEQAVKYLRRQHNSK